MIAQQKANIIITTLTIHSNCTSSTDIQLSKMKLKDMPVAVKYMSKERQTHKLFMQLHYVVSKGPRS